MPRIDPYELELMAECRKGMPWRKDGPKSSWKFDGPMCKRPDLCRDEGACHFVRSYEAFRRNQEYPLPGENDPRTWWTLRPRLVDIRTGAVLLEPVPCCEEMDRERDDVRLYGPCSIDCPRHLNAQPRIRIVEVPSVVPALPPAPVRIVWHPGYDGYGWAM